jgi:hypothetical protein
MEILLPTVFWEKIFYLLAIPPFILYLSFAGHRFTLDTAIGLVDLYVCIHARTRPHAHARPHNNHCKVRESDFFNTSSVAAESKMK